MHYTPLILSLLCACGTVDEDSPGFVLTVDARLNEARVSAAVKFALGLFGTDDLPSEHPLRVIVVTGFNSLATAQFTAPPDTISTYDLGCMQEAYVVGHEALHYGLYRLWDVGTGHEHTDEGVWGLELPSFERSVYDRAVQECGVPEEDRYE